MSRWKAAGLYLLMCAGVASAVLAFMLFVWFPWPLFEMAGGAGLLLLVVAVDMVLGPLIVLIIYKPEKKGLKFDLAVVVLLQLSALVYGLYNVYLARPVYIVFTIDRFDVVAYKDLDDKDLAKVSAPQFKGIPLGRPRYIAVERPADPAMSNKLLDAALAGKDLQMFPQYYVPYAAKLTEILQHAKPAALIEQRAPDALKRFLEDTGRSIESVRYLPVRAAKGDGTVLLDSVSAEPLKILLVDPW